MCRAFSFPSRNAGDALPGSEIALMDIDPARLPMMTAIGQRMVAEAGSDLRITIDDRPGRGAG